MATLENLNSKLILFSNWLGPAVPCHAASLPWPTTSFRVLMEFSRAFSAPPTKKNLYYRVSQRIFIFRNTPFVTNNHNNSCGNEPLASCQVSCCPIQSRQHFHSPVYSLTGYHSPCSINTLMRFVSISRITSRQANM